MGDRLLVRHHQHRERLHELRRTSHPQTATATPMIYDNIDEMPTGHIDAILGMSVLLARELRRLRRTGDLHSTSCQAMCADGPVDYRCDHNDRITMRPPGSDPLDITPLVDRWQDYAIEARAAE